MKTKAKQYGPIALLLAFIVLLQGCTLQKSASVTLEEAVQEQRKVQITTVDNQTLKFKRIVKRNGEYYGVKWLNDNTRDTKLFENDIEKIKIENKTMSIIVFTPPIALALCIISASIFNLTFPASFYYKDSITF